MMLQAAKDHSKGAHSMDLSSLPFEVIATILSHVPLKERLSTCALVCRTWATAGAGASKVLTVHLRSQAQADNLAEWLAHYGTSMEHMSVSTDPQAFEELQWKQRRERLKCYGDSEVTQDEEALMQQLLAESKEEPTPQCFTAKLPLPRLLGLRRLSLENVRVHSTSWPQTQQPSARGAAAEQAPGTATAAGKAGVSCNGTSSSIAPAAARANDTAAHAGGAACSSDGAVPGVQIDPAWLSHLTHLHADSCFVSLLRIFGGNLQPLSNLQALRITLGPCDRSFMGSYWTQAGNEAFQALSAQCTRLQKLLLGTSNITADGLRHLSCMRRLQHVELHVPGGSVRRPVSLAAWLEPLPAQQLTQLVVKPLACRTSGKALDLSPSSSRQLSRFSHLQHLDISYGANFVPRVLAPLTALTHLQLDEVDVATATGEPGTYVGSQQQLQQQQNQPQQGTGGAAAMLAVLPCLQELRVLQLCPGVLPLPHAPLEQYSALTASSHLTFLSLYHCQLPAGVASVMFSSIRSLPALNSIRMPQPPAGQRPTSADTLSSPSPFLSSGAAAALRAARVNNHISNGSSSSGCSTVSRTGPPYGPGSLDSLAACCPNLGQLWLTAAIAADADLAPLQQLTVLTELQLGGAVVDDSVCERVLGRLGQLQRLDLVQCPRFTDAGLAYLTALTALTSLQVRDCGLSHFTAGLGQVLYMCKREEGSYSSIPVCERLRQQCSNSRDCLLVMLQQRDKQLVAATAALAAAEAKATAAEAKAAAAARVGR